MTRILPGKGRANEQQTQTHDEQERVGTDLAEIWNEAETFSSQFNGHEDH